MPEALRLSGLVAGYRPDLPILRGIDLALEPGGMTAVVGPNGAGKSTLIKAIAGLVPISGGTVTRGGADITGLRPDRMAEHGMAYVPQTDNVFRGLTIRENLDLALRRAGRAAPERLARLQAMFPMLADKADIRGGALSGGQRQMLAVAMALATEPSLVMLDEPSAGLAPNITADVLAMARRLTEDGTTVLLVEQNVKQALALADRCIVLAEGRIEADGPATELREGTTLAEIFLGARRRVA
ncbi:ABC transporter ATP-binding protein [Jannaschia seohaensis]|uniref:Branched-chain amino acid transport system ATP-binding protein n=1 Tax=Jannaschia seohaensis TaxID=475081 RepID=A0A2Y9AY04_9RHOB|nr:ABC transporter ATP-binding protein [Jannaschia seohaensis]PWJ16538.1 branched-chain amino acid transport system ATP-binding protein [Jannaschia seohaensis]SSA48775.1 branched-chain amino acid transport system ATP-binding protein [Jannaschia seohaensis]